MYGTAVEVAALAKMWTRDGVWYDYVGPTPGPEVLATNPTLTQVETWLTNISSLIDVALSGAGFIVPVDWPDEAVWAINMLATSIVADLCHAANSSGRFFTERVVERGLSPMVIVNQQIANWVKEWTDGFIQMGVARVPTELSPTSFSIPPERQL
jgi:hypothetical protein